MKRGAYARAGVPAYWIVRPTTRDILVCSQPDTTMGDDTQRVLVAHDAILVSPTLPIQTPVAACFPPDTTPWTMSPLRALRGVLEWAQTVPMAG